MHARRLALLLLAMLCPLSAQTDLVTYLNGANGRLYCALALSDETLLVGGTAQDLAWVPAGVAPVSLGATTAAGSSLPASDPADEKQGVYSFLMHLSADGASILNVFHFPPNIGGAIRDIKTNTPPDAPTGELYLSGFWTNTGDNTPNHCWFGKLDQNVLNGNPTQLSWIWTDCKNGGGNKLMQNWDVGADGKIVYSSYKRPAAGAWHAVYRLSADGSAHDVVTHWWDHGASCVSLKPYNHDMRSLTWDDYNLVSSHSGMSRKKGRYPHDFYYAGPKGIDDNGGGYTGYRSDGKASTTIAIAVDKRDNTMYIGFNTPVANNTHDFEPTVMMMRPEGEIVWYSHLYDEWTDENANGVVDAGETHQCPPDQYVDGIAIDYTQPATAPQIAVLARCHGNAPRNFWHGTSAFHNQFTGTNGNEHLSWLGRFRGDNGEFVNATWLAEYDPYGEGSLGTPYSEPLLQEWPNHNSGWADLKTTKGHDLTIDRAGQAYVLANSRGPVTTTNAYQKATPPGTGLFGCWTDFARVHTADFSSLVYSTILSGPCDSTTGNGGGNISLQDIVPLPDGMLVVGYHVLQDGAPKGEAMPTSQVPSWGASAPSGETPVMARLSFEQPPYPVIHHSGRTRALPSRAGLHMSAGAIVVSNHSGTSCRVRLLNCAGAVVATTSGTTATLRLPTRDLPTGAYIVQVNTEHRNETAIPTMLVH